MEKFPDDLPETVDRLFYQSDQSVFELLNRIYEAVVEHE